jgi:hypothetical protein
MVGSGPPVTPIMITRVKRRLQDEGEEEDGCGADGWA